ncbi:Amino acid adenylation domain-containing protein [Sulfidibacter corallicola]|uniref:Amino acid adenylation domain-containing protein n=1 Tax=Sulfidibacter corallicola TaxID=2818388 RepID=A0A8A4TJ32_SULCO|nr:amino acid adenylation domain-containing protein [Sulfidibacter corallicola]QTD50039.1 amino acid adenylation domain-containing protein [Sulfidibacter corallicola]
MTANRERLKQLLQQKLADRTGPQPTSWGQRALWFLQKLQPDCVAYNVGAAIKLHFELNLDAFETALDQVVTAFAVLRTHFQETASGGVEQVVASQIPRCLERIDARAWEPEHLRHTIDEAMNQPFDLTTAPLMRMRHYRIPGGKGVLTFSIHHIICDYTSIRLLFDHLTKAYQRLEAGESARVMPPQHSYVDYCRTQRNLLASDRGKALESFWRETLAAPGGSGSLPWDHPPKAMPSYRGSSVHFTIETIALKRIRQMAVRCETTPFVLLLTVYAILLHRCSGDRHIRVGVPTMGRNRPEFADQISFFVNPVVMHVDFEGGPSFRCLVEQVRQTMFRAMAHSDFPLQKLADLRVSSAGRQPGHLFSADFNLIGSRDAAGPSLMQAVAASEPHRFDWNGWLVETYPFEERGAQLPLSMNVELAANRGYGRLVYADDLFEKATVEEIAAHFQTLLTDALTHPDRSCVKLRCCHPSTAQRHLVDFNAAPQRETQPEPLLDAFARQVATRPQAIALETEQEHWSYGELDAQIHHLADRLRTCGIRPEDRVGVAAPLSVTYMVAVLAVMKAGGAYVPLDPKAPEGRLRHQITDSGMSLIVTDPEHAPAVADRSVPVLTWNTDEARALSRTLPQVPNRALAGNTAYLIYTSGTTGRPKGVAITRGQLDSYLARCAVHYRREAGYGNPAHAAATFDLTITSLFPPLMCGQKVVLFEHNRLCMPLGDYLNRHPNFTALKLTPSHLALLAEHWRPESIHRSRGNLVLGGEPLLAEHLTHLRNCGPELRFFNEYGPTEATVGCMSFEVPKHLDEKGAVPLGRPMEGTRIYVLDAHLQPTPTNVAGEIFIGGNQVARGYWRAPALTAERFVPDPFAKRPGARMFRTGDFAHFRADGHLMFQGRRDDQIKIRGYRVTRGEIEDGLRRLPEVRDARVLLDSDSRGKRLAAYLETDHPFEIDELRRHLHAKLPEYMIPNSVHTITRFPLTTHGKVDVAKLAELREAPRQPVAHPPGSQEERILAEVWCRVLDREQVGIHQNFFDLGGHSLLLLHMQAELTDRFAFKPALMDFFRYPTISTYARHLAQRTLPKTTTNAIAARAQRQQQARAHQHRPALPAWRNATP